MTTLEQINEFLESQPIALADSKEALDELKDSGINFIAGECILMHYKPHSIHKFHGSLKKLFNRFPK